MRVLLTGGTGFVGRRLVPQLLAAGHEVTAAVRGAAPAGTTAIRLDDASPEAAWAEALHGMDALVHVAGLAHLRRGGAGGILNCAYGHGSSVLEVIDLVKKVSGVDFPVTLGARRPGDPARIVAAAERIRSTLGWRPRFDDLETIVTHALDWERRLLARDAA